MADEYGFLFTRLHLNLLDSINYIADNQSCQENGPFQMQRSLNALLIKELSMSDSFDSRHNPPEVR